MENHSIIIPKNGHGKSHAKKESCRKSWPSTFLNGMKGHGIYKIL